MACTTLGKRGRYRVSVVIEHRRLPNGLYHEAVLPRSQSRIRQADTTRAGWKFTYQAKAAVVVCCPHGKVVNCVLAAADRPPQTAFRGRCLDAHAIVDAGLYLRALFVIVPGYQLHRREIALILPGHAKGLEPGITAVAVDDFPLAPG